MGEKDASPADEAHEASVELFALPEGTPAEFLAESPAGAGLDSGTRSSLHKLVSDVDGDPHIVKEFVLDFLGLLDARLAALQDNLSVYVTRVDCDAIVVSILSLETTSAMLGASDVVETARDLRLAVERHEHGRAPDLFERLIVAVNAMRESLADQGFIAQPRARSAAGWPADNQRRALSR